MFYQKQQGLNILKHLDRILAKRMSALVSDCMPVKMSVMHCCKGLSAPALDLILPAMLFCVGRYFRFHLRFHSGMDKDMLLALKEYGIASEHVHAFLLGGGFSHSDFEDWLSKRKEMEKQGN
jgi:hypothetical protein